MKLLTKKGLTGLVAAFVFALLAVFTPLAPSVNAQQCDPNSGIAGGVDCANPGDDVPQTLFGEGSIFTTIINILLFVIGAISVIMLIVGGIRYTTSAGDSKGVEGAKNTIMYAIIGLVVAFLAFAVVNWVLGALMPN